MKRALLYSVVVCVACLSSISLADVVLLDDYEGGGAFNFSYDQNPANAGVNGTNSAYDAGTDMTVEWATEWEGGVSLGAAVDLDAYDTYTFDIMLTSGQPVQDGSEFYFQFNMQSGVGYSYWEGSMSQTNILANDTWYRVQFPFSALGANSGGGGVNPTDFAAVEGVTLGLRFDPDAVTYDYKVVSIDNVSASDAGVSGLTITAIPEPATLAFVSLGLLALFLRRRAIR